MSYENVEAVVIFLLGIGYILIPESDFSDRIDDLKLAECYSRVFQIVPNPDDIPAFKHNELGKYWERVY